MMKRWLAFLALSYLLTFILMACGRVGTSAPAGSGTAGTAPPAALGAEVHMNSANFVQTEITHSKGAKRETDQRRSNHAPHHC
jgi:hypothetical protein